MHLPWIRVWDTSKEGVGGYVSKNHDWWSTNLKWVSCCLCSPGRYNYFFVSIRISLRAEELPRIGCLYRWKRKPLFSCRPQKSTSRASCSEFHRCFRTDPHPRKLGRRISIEGRQNEDKLWRKHRWRDLVSQILTRFGTHATFAANTNVVSWTHKMIMKNFRTISCVPSVCKNVASFCHGQATSAIMSPPCDLVLPGPCRSLGLPPSPRHLRTAEWMPPTWPKV